MPSLFASLCLFLSFQYACAVVLKPVVQRTDDGLLSKRATLSDLDLQSSTNLYWGASGDASGTPSLPTTFIAAAWTDLIRIANPDAVLANFTIYTPDDHENILSMEKFSGMLSAVSCSNTALQLSFKDDSDFDYAQRIWDWVNAHNNNSFVLVTGQGDCGANTDREPFRVNSIVYDTSGRTANLQGIALTWASAAHTYDLHVGHISAPGSGVSRRDYTKDWSLDFAHNFSTSKTWSKGPFSIGLDASGSGVAGEFDFELDVKTTVFVPTDVVVKLQPKGVSATAMAKLSLSGDLPDSSFGESVNVLSITLDEFQIPKILQIGPTLDIALGILAGPISGGASVTGGVTVSIPDSAIIELDLLHSSNNQFSGWTPSGEILPWEVDANVSGTVQVYAEPDLNLEASILDYGYEIGLGMKLPYVQAELDALYSSTGACPSNSLPHHIFGVKLTPEIGASLFIEASKANDLGDPLFNKTIAVSFPSRR